jgi:cysteine desulfurase
VETHQAVTVYLDYQATTPLAPEVRGAMLPWITEKFGNPHSTHKLGREAAAMVEVAREAVSALLPPGGKLYFTSGATEAINWAMRCTRAGGLMVSPTEHAAVLDTAEWLKAKKRSLRFLTLDDHGVPNAKQEIPATVALVAAMLVNNEIGAIAPIAKLAKQAQSAGALFLCDAVQGFGRIPVPSGPDLIAISAHKIHGPKGIGALWVKNGVEIEPLLLGGGQEGGLRSGTLSPALCVGFGTAATIARQRMEADAAHVKLLFDEAMALIPRGWELNGPTSSDRYKGNLNLRCEGVDAARLISDVRGVAFSAGSACASGSGRPSHVLRALGLSDVEARSSIRIGFGRYTTRSELREGLRLIFAAAASQSSLAA